MPSKKAIFPPRLWRPGIGWQPWAGQCKEPEMQRDVPRPALRYREKEGPARLPD
jgi:hypothetical protein